MCQVCIIKVIFYLTLDMKIRLLFIFTPLNSQAFYLRCLCLETRASEKLIKRQKQTRVVVFCNTYIHRLHIKVHHFCKFDQNSFRNEQNIEELRKTEDLYNVFCQNMYIKSLYFCFKQQHTFF